MSSGHHFQKYGRYCDEFQVRAQKGAEGLGNTFIEFYFFKINADIKQRNQICFFDTGYVSRSSHPISEKFK